MGNETGNKSGSFVMAFSNRKTVYSGPLLLNSQRIYLNEQFWKKKVPLCIQCMNIILITELYMIEVTGINMV